MDENYFNYLHSDAWQEKRLAVLRRARYHCEHCGQAVPLHVHHKHYMNFGNEPIEDLEALCEDCHRSADARRKQASFDKGLNTWATKCFGDNWESTIGYEEAAERFEEWIAKQD